MDDESTTGLIDIRGIDLDDLKRLRNPAIMRALQRCVEEPGDAVAGFQSAI